MDFDLKKALREYPVCQRRTGKNKQFTFMIDNYIVKGPSKREKFERVRKISHKMTLWKTRYIVHPLQHYYISPEGYYLIFNNLALGYPIQTTLNVESFSNHNYQVIQRNGLIQLNNVIENLDWIKDHIPWLVFSMCQMAALGVGDMGLFNILVDINKKEIYIVDYEDCRNDTKDNEFFYFSKMPRKSLHNLWLTSARPYYKTIISMLNNIADHELEYADNLRYIANCLQRYVPKVVINISKPIVVQKYNNTLLGKMVYKGTFGGSITFSGYPIDQVKSALQKYIRRNMKDKAIMAGIELYRMAELANGKSIQTNLYNRLAVIAAEDIGIANLPLVINVIKLILNEDRDINMLITMITKLAESNKTRIMSHLYRSYMTDEGHQCSINLGLKTTDDNTQINDDDESVEKGVNWLMIMANAKMSNSQALSDASKYYLLKFYELLCKRDKLALYWLENYIKTSKVMNKDQTHLKKTINNSNFITRKSDNPLQYVWLMIKEFLDNDLYNTIHSIFYKSSDNRTFLMLALSSILYDVKYEPSNLISTCLAKDYYHSLITGQYDFELDDFVIDLHTKKGRQESADRSKFVSEGALVIPQCQKYYDPVLAEIYKSS